MNNAAKFLITALAIVAGVFMFKTYKAGGFEDINANPIMQEADENVEAH